MTFMEFITFAMIVLTIYLPIYSLVDRVCECKERCAGVKED